MTGCVLIEAYFVDSHSWLCEETKSTHGQLCAEVHIFGMVEYLANHVAQGLQYLKKTLNVHSAECVVNNFYGLKMDCQPPNYLFSSTLSLKVPSNTEIDISENCVVSYA